MASLVSFAPLAHALLVSPMAWAVLRVLTGSCMVGIYIIAESWLNGRASSANRGALLAVYMLILYRSIVTACSTSSSWPSAEISSELGIATVCF